MIRLRRTLLAPYHYAWALLSALWYGFPSRRLTVIGVTGTKGKSSVAEMLYAILTAAGYNTALAGTIRFAIGKESKPNLFKMTLPGRGFIQKFLAESAEKKCTHAIIEITSEAALQYRHLFLDLDALVFTNLQKEHIESHGSFEKYFRAKLSIGEALARSMKRPRAVIARADDAHSSAFLALPIERKISFSLADAADTKVRADGIAFSYKGVDFALALPGEFNILNALAAIKTAEAFGVSLEICAQGLRELARISGRVERIEAGQDFIAVVDYAHTPDSLKALYSAFPHERKICVLGNTGGGRDAWKRPEMGRIADEACEKVILTNEDPYDEDPRAIIDAMAKSMRRAPEIIMDRREAIRHALRAARPGDAVLVSGKGTDPFIMGPKGSKIPWSDARVVREELERLHFLRSEAS
jgi:UDP-N-acetylmuramoyl-L-alanyl-D-glutamate--2,6-diaminopimelate ligase